jgi:hypothetical protein
MRIPFALVSLLVAGLGSEARAHLIFNASFETFNGAFAGDGCSQLTTASTTLTLYTPVGGEIAICHAPNSYQITPSEGSNFLDIAGYGNTLGKGISQQLSGLTIGHSYLFTADLGVSNIASCVPGATCGGPVSVLVTIGGVSQTLTHDSAGAGVQWANYGFTFVADNATPILTIVGSALPAGGAFIGLDNLMLDEVIDAPEPALTWLLLAVVAPLSRSRLHRPRGARRS